MRALRCRRRVDERHRVHDAVGEPLREHTVLGGDPRGVGHRRMVDVLEQRRARGNRLRQTLSEVGWIEQITNLQPDAANLVGVGRADAAMRRADSAVPARGLVELVQVYVIGQHQLSTLGNPQAIQRDAALGQLVHLVQERLRINDGTTADEARHARLEDAGRDEVEFEDSVLVDNGMAGIVTALKADDKVGLLGKEVNNASLAFISPLSTDNRRDRHIHSFYRVRLPFWPQRM